MPQALKPSPLVPFIGLMCVIIAVAPLAAYNLVRHLGAPPAWSAAVLFASIAVCVAGGILMVIRLAQRR